jgi:hypothetical protein
MLARVMVLLLLLLLLSSAVCLHRQPISQPAICAWRGLPGLQLRLSDTLSQTPKQLTTVFWVSSPSNRWAPTPLKKHQLLSNITIRSPVADKHRLAATASRENGTNIGKAFRPASGGTGIARSGMIEA